MFLKKLDLQFFSQKKDEHDEEVEETEDELEDDIEDAVLIKEKKKHTKKKGDDSPEWMDNLVNKIAEAINPTQTETKTPEAIPVPKAPPVKEKEETPAPVESKLSQFLKSIW